jgi:ribosomal protein L37E
MCNGHTDFSDMPVGSYNFVAGEFGGDPSGSEKFNHVPHSTCLECGFGFARAKRLLASEKGFAALHESKGDGTAIVKLGITQIHDGKWHHIRVEKAGDQLEIEVDRPQLTLPLRDSDWNFGADAFALETCLDCGEINTAAELESRNFHCRRCGRPM